MPSKFYKEINFENAEPYLPHRLQAAASGSGISSALAAFNAFPQMLA